MSKISRQRKHEKIRRKVSGSPDKPRLAVYRSNQHIFAQIIDDTKGITLVSGSDIKEKGTKKEKAYNLGKEIAVKATKLKIVNVVFDRGGFLYQGRVAEVARGAREGGLKF
jgi:large subunit ribosomal protein L18